MRQPFGQNFLTDRSVACKIVDSADIRPGETVIEIGPGKGALTGLIAQKADRVIAVELDRNLATGLREKFSALRNVEIVESDFLKYDPPNEPLMLKVISNLPYSAATPIIERFLPWLNWTEAVVMVQREVGERIASLPGGREYGVLSILCRYYAEPTVLFPVGPESFSPAPEVESIVLRLRNLHPDAPPEGLFRLVKAAFQQRRKTVLNSLSAGLGMPKDRLEAVLSGLNIDPGIRPEKLSLKDYLDLTNQLKSNIIG